MASGIDARDMIARGKRMIDNNARWAEALLISGVALLTIGFGVSLVHMDTERPLETLMSFYWNDRALGRAAALSVLVGVVAAIWGGIWTQRHRSQQSTDDRTHTSLGAPLRGA